MAKAKQERPWHPRFKEYMEYIVTHENYKGLKYTRKENGEIGWIATKKSEIGKERIRWAEEKAQEIGIPIEPGVYAKVMFEVHPLKEKPCQICGRVMSLYYVYPSKALLKALNKEFSIEFDQLQSVFEIANILADSGKSEEQIKTFFIKKFKLNEKKFMNESIDNILKKCEEICRNGNSNVLGPGAMSNFPDRFDGFHSYNRCCRSQHDKGRSAENLRTYNKDRRAYEYWSDGNLHAANQFMNSNYFIGASADHIGPLSLGFKHDSLLLQKMPVGDNSSKRDRLLYEDIEKIIEIEEENPGFTAISWFSRKLWEFIRARYKINSEKIEDYRLALKQNMINYMEILWQIMSRCEKSGEKFLIKYLLKPKFKYFQCDYVFDNNGRIIETSKRHMTDATKKEINRFIRIAFEAINDYHNKTNRNSEPSLDEDDCGLLDQICVFINNKNCDEAYDRLKKLMDNLQNKLIEKVQ